MGKVHKVYIDGRWTGTSREGEVIEKYTGKAMATVSLCGEKEAVRAISAAARAFPGMAAMPAYKRAGILENIAAGIRERADEIAGVIAREAGKAWKYAAGEVDRTVETFTFAAAEARSIHGETVPMSASSAGVGRYGLWFREPVGVVVAISPFNFPLNLVAHKVAPAIAAGCTVVLKPASYTPLTALILAEIVDAAGLPPGAFNLVLGGGSTVGKQLVTDPRPAKISFTGSMEVGTWIRQNSGLKRVTLELGNNSGVIVDEDSDLDWAVERCLMGSFANSGQVCISVQRIYLHRSIAEGFTDKFLEGAGKLKVGDPVERDTDVGPMIDPGDVIRVEEWVAEALSQGARILTGGERLNERVYPPTVITDVTPEMKVVCNELFAPVVTLSVFDDFADAVERVDDTVFGLQAGVFTGRIDRAIEAIRGINVGGVMVNDVPTFRVDHMPYGGNRSSGIGREGLRYAIEEMTQIKMVVIKP